MDDMGGLRKEYRQKAKRPPDPGGRFILQDRWRARGARPALHQTAIFTVLLRRIMPQATGCAATARGAFHLISLMMLRSVRSPESHAVSGGNE